MTGVLDRENILLCSNLSIKNSNINQVLFHNYINNPCSQISLVLYYNIDSSVYLLRLEI